MERPVVCERAGPSVAFNATDLHGPQALSRLDQATALLYGRSPDLERACQLATEALTAAANERFGSVTQRAREFLDVAEPWSAEPAVRELRELIHAYTTATMET
jgi:hypothetical protein